MKKLKGILFFFAVFIICVAATCRKDTGNCHYRIWVNNQTGNAIYFGYAFDSSLLRLNYDPGASPESFKCEGQSIKGRYTSGCFESVLLYPSYGKLYMFLFDAAVIETRSWDDIRQNRLMLRRYDLTKTQLDSCNWVIAYP